MHHITNTAHIFIGDQKEILTHKHQENGMLVLKIQIMDNQKVRVVGKDGKIGTIKEDHGDGNKTIAN
jgi:hypothetical protein